MSNLRYSTYDGWRSVGRRVSFGEKHRKRDRHGSPLFHIDQTVILNDEMIESDWDTEEADDLWWGRSWGDL